MTEKDALIAKNINQKCGQVHYDVDGCRNGIILQQEDAKVFVFIHAKNASKRIAYEMIAVDLQTNKTFSHPLTFMHYSIGRQREVQKISIELQICPDDQSILLLSIAEYASTSVQKMLLLAQIQIQQLTQNEGQIILYKVLLKDAHYLSAKWHPHIPQAFVVLTQESLCLFHVSNVNHPSREIALFEIKKKCDLKPQMLFTDFCIFPSAQAQDLFSINLLTLKGDFVKVWPLLLQNTKISKENLKHLKQLPSYFSYFCQCKLFETSQNDTIYLSFQDSLQQSCQLFYSHPTQLPQRLFYTQINTIPINDYFFLLFLSCRINTQNTMIILSCDYISNRFQSQQLVQMVGREAETGDMRLGNQQLMEGKAYVSQGGRLYIVHLQGYLSVVQRGQEGQPYTVELLYQIEDSSLYALFISLGVVYVLRNSVAALCFDSIILTTLTISSAIAQINALLLKATRNPQAEQVEVQRVKDVEVKDVKDLEELQSTTTNYCEKVRQKLQNEINCMKDTYLRLKNNQQLFDRNCQNRQKLQQVMQQIEKNNSKINLIIKNKQRKDSSKAEQSIKQLLEYVRKLHQKRYKLDSHVEKQAIHSLQRIIDSINEIKDKINMWEEKINKDNL